MTGPSIGTTAPIVMPAPVGRTVSRNEGVDGFRYVAFLFVVLLHCLPRSDAAPLEQVLDQFCRFAVPYFFLVSGYFLGMGRRSSLDQIGQVIQRIGPPFLIWLAFYCLMSGVDLGGMAAQDWARLLLTGGPAFHLWFLPALGMGIAGVVLLRGLGASALSGAAALVFAVALAFGPYQAALGLPDLPLGMRNGPFFSFPYVAVGYFIGALGWRPRFGVAAILAVAGLLAQAAESLVLTGSLSMPFDFTAGTLLFGVGVFLMALRADERGPLPKFATLGRNAFAMYAVHAAFLLYLPPVRDLSLAPRVLVVAALSTLFAMIVSRVPFLRRVLG